jgi:hypothetical protein
MSRPASRMKPVNRETPVDSESMKPESVMRCVLKELESRGLELSTGTMNRLRHLTKRPSCSAPKEKPCRRSETGWCWTHDKMCGEYDASKFCGCGYPKEHSGDCHAPKEKP